MNLKKDEKFKYLINYFNLLKQFNFNLLQHK